MGDRILYLRQASLCWMPQPLPALCLPEPSASSHSYAHAASWLHLSISFQRPCLLLQKTPAMIGGSDHSTCPQYSFSSDFLERSLFFKICMFN